MAILERLVKKGTDEFKKYQELKEELALNKKKADEYEKIVQDPKKSLEDKLRANDEFGA